MHKIKLLVIDDEEQGRNSVKSVIEKYCPYIELLGFSNSKENAIRDILSLKPDVITLDIQLGDGTGFDVLKSLENPPKTIFITAFDSFAVKAFKFNAIDYILKPFDQLELVEALSKSTALLENVNYNSPEKNFKDFDPEKPTKLVVPTSHGFEIILLNEISHLTADNNYTTFHLINGARKVVSKTLKHYEDLLKDTGFFRCHQSHMIQINQIKSYNKGEGGIVYLQSGAQIDVSRRKKEELIQLVNHNFFR